MVSSNGVLLKSVTAISNFTVRCCVWRRRTLHLQNHPDIRSPGTGNLISKLYNVLQQINVILITLSSFVL